MRSFLDLCKRAAVYLGLVEASEADDRIDLAAAPGAKLVLFNPDVKIASAGLILSGTAEAETIDLDGNPTGSTVISDLTLSMQHSPLAVSLLMASDVIATVHVIAGSIDSAEFNLDGVRYTEQFL